MLVSSSQPLEIIIKFDRDFFFSDGISKVLGNLKQIKTKKKSGGNSKNPEIPEKSHSCKYDQQYYKYKTKHLLQNLSNYMKHLVQ